MLIGEMGFRAALVVCCLVIPAGLFIRRKIRLAAARRKEIERLLALASEEAARAELEALIGYTVPAYVSDSYSSPSSPSTATPGYYCVICYTPTKKVCARCKAVRYCSFKCQIIHWRQGHKDDCSPAPHDSGNSGEQSRFAHKVSKLEHHDDYVYKNNTDEGYDPASHLVHPQTLSRKNNVTSDRSLHERVFPSERVNGTSSSTIDASFVDNDGHFDFSTSEDESVHELGASDEDLHPATDNHDASVDVGSLKETKSSLPEAVASAMSVNSVPMSSNTTEETEKVFARSRQCSSSSSLHEPSSSSSGFWDGSLNFSKTMKVLPKESAPISSNGARDGISLDSRIRLSYSFHSSHKMLQPSGSPNSELLNHPHSGAPEGANYTKEASLSGTEAVDSSAGRKFTLSTSDQHNSIDKETKYAPNTTKPQVVDSSSSSSSDCSVAGRRPVAATASEDLTFLRSKAATMKSPESSQSLKDEKGGASLTTCKSRSSSVTRRNSASTEKSLKVGNGSEVAFSTPQHSSFSQLVTRGLKASKLKVDQPKASKLSKIYSFGFRSGPTWRSSEKGLFPYELFVELYKWNRVELLPRGLINCGNSCYANAVLQCLTFTPPLTAYLLEALHSKTCLKKDWCFTCEFERLILSAKDGGPPLSPIGILCQIQKIGSHLSNGREEDAHEFLRYLVDTMQSTCLAEAGVSGPKSLEDETTLIGLTFGGYLRSKIRCSRCHGKSERHERMMDLAVEIEGDIDTLEAALRRFTRSESLDGENKYQCGRCKSFEKAKKKLTILEAPNVLTISLKRFQYGKFGKLNKFIRFPEILNLAPYMRGSCDKSPIYRLYGAIVHLDIMNATFSGHYVSYVRNAQNKWFKIDDSTVKPTDLDNVLTKGAYMLFYSRCSPRAPRSIRSSMISKEVPSKVKFADSDPLRGGAGGNLPHHAPTPFSHRDPEMIYSKMKPDIDNTSNASSIFSHSEEGSSSTTDSNRESTTSADDLEYMSVEVPTPSSNYWRNSSDSDTSSSSSSAASSPMHLERASLLPESEKHGSSSSGFSGMNGSNHGKMGNMSSEGMVSGISILQPGSDEHGKSRKVNSSNGSSSRISCRETDSGRLGGSDRLLDTEKSGVYLRKPPRTKAV